MELIHVMTFKIIFICLQNYEERYYIGDILAKLGCTKHWHQPYIGNHEEGMRKDINKFLKNCTICQKYKKNQKKYGILPPKMLP